MSDKRDICVTPGLRQLQLILLGWRDTSAVKTKYYSPKGPKFCFSIHSRQATTAYHPSSRNPMPSAGLHGHLHSCGHTTDINRDLKM